MRVESCLRKLGKKMTGLLLVAVTSNSLEQIYEVTDGGGDH